jgi:hypothetical protein
LAETELAVICQALLEDDFGRIVLVLRRDRLHRAPSRHAKSRALELL